MPAVGDDGIALEKRPGVDALAQSQAKVVDAGPLRAEMPMVPSGSTSVGQVSILLTTVSKVCSRLRVKSGCGMLPSGPRESAAAR